MTLYPCFNRIGMCSSVCVIGDQPNTRHFSIELGLFKTKFVTCGMFPVFDQLGNNFNQNIHLDSSLTYQSAVDPHWT